MKQNKKRYLSLLCILAFIFSNVHAQTILSLQECKQKALQHNQTIKAKQASLNASKADIELSKRASLPNFDFTANYLFSSDPAVMNIPGFELPTTNGQPSGVYYPGGSTPLMYDHTYSASASASLPIYLGGKLVEARKIAQYATAIAESDLALSEIDVKLSMEQQYWTLVSLIESVKISEKSIEFLNNVVVDMQNRFDIGVVTKNEVLKTKVELNNAKLSHITLNDNIALLKMAINQSVGADIDAPLNIADTTIQLTDDVRGASVDNENINKREELAILKKQNEILQSELTLLKADYRPQLVSFANYGVQNPNHLSQQENELVWTAGASLSIPVFHWGERKLKSKKAKLNIESAEYQLDHTKEMLQLEIRQSIFKLEESFTRLQFTAEALLQAEENLALESNRLKEEVATTTDLLNAQMQWQKAQADYISAKATVKINEALYYKAVGVL